MVKYKLARINNYTIYPFLKIKFSSMIMIKTVSNELRCIVNIILRALNIRITLFPYNEFFKIYSKRVRNATSVKSVHGHAHVGINVHPLEKRARGVSRRVEMRFELAFIIECILEALHEFMHKKFGGLDCENKSCLFASGNMIGVKDSQFYYKKPCENHQLWEATKGIRLIETLLTMKEKKALNLVHGLSKIDENQAMKIINSLIK